MFYAFDPSGSAAQRLDAGGDILTYAAFYAYGERVGVSGSTFQPDEPDEYSAPDPFSGFGGQWGYYDDNGNGAELLGHRYYEIGIGRFLTRDPIGYAGGVNLYNYVQNNPATQVDPTGYCDPATDLGVDGDLSMRSLHPGMERGTYQNGLALDEIQGFKETLVNAALAPVGEFGEAAEAEEAAVAEQAAQEELAAATPQESNIVLGLGEDLENFRTAMDGTSYQAGGLTGTGFGGSIADFYSAIGNEYNQINFNLTAPNFANINPSVAADLGADIRREYPNTTNWELNVIRNSPEIWNRITFWQKTLDGSGYEPVANPFL